MSRSWVRVVAAFAAFVLVALGSMALLFSFAPDAATNSWALLTLLAVGAGIAVYALIERAQTGRVDSIREQLPTRIWVLMPVAIALNIVLGQAVGSALRIPIYLDSIGTILVAALGGPIAGALTGLLSNLLWAYVVPPPFQGPTAAAFAVTAVAVGLLAGTFTRYGFLRPRPGRRGRELLVAALVAIGLIVAMAAIVVRYQAFLLDSGQPGLGSDGIAPQSDSQLWVVLGWVAVILVILAVLGMLYLLFARRDVTVAWVIVAGIVTGIVGALISAPIAANLFGGVTGGGTDFIVAALRQGGADIQNAVLGQSLISDPIDKTITYVLAYLILGAMATRTKARFPQGDLLIPDGDQLDPAGMALRATR
ncbi:MAG: hypothetical protein U0869_11315 [Chloroflexota bacterium]